MTTTTHPRVPERVQAGATWLDANVPDWLDRINPATLDLASCITCVLGQLFGNYWDAPIAPACSYVPDVQGTDRAADHGFTVYYDWDASGDADNFAELNEAWRALIADRRTVARAKA